MLLSRVSVVSVLMLSLGGFVALASPNPLFTQTVAQNPEAPKLGDRSRVKWMDQLNLTQEQKQKLERIQTRYKKEITQRQQAVRQANKELREMMIGNIPAEKIRSQHKQVQFLRQQVEDSRLESMLAIRELLTQEQRSKLGQLMEQRQQNSRK